MTIVNKKIDFLFVKFPFVFPIIYCFILYYFPEFENHLVILTILLLGEPHFAATWPFFLNDRNKTYIKKNRIPLIILPALIVITSIIMFFTIKNFFLLIFFAANVFHVTRQSTGISKLFLKDEKEKNFQTNSIYLFSSLFFLIGIFRFYFNLMTNTDLVTLSLVILSSIGLLIIIYSLIFKNIKNIFTLITGIMIFYPVCFVSNPVHVILMGVTMHYSQYLVLTYLIEKRRSKENRNFQSDSKQNLFGSFFKILLFYSLAMTLFSYFGRLDISILQNLILIPIIGQMLHFYIDSHLWKFSDKHHRENTLKFIGL